MIAISMISSIEAADVLELYVDTETKQIYAEPGPGRVKMGSFERVDSAPAVEDASGKAQDDVRISLDKKGLGFERADGRFDLTFGGRLHADATYEDNDALLGAEDAPVKSNDGTEIRRARLSMKGTLWSDYEFMTEVDFAGDRVSVKDLFLVYTAIPLAPITEFTVGNQKHAISMEVQESSNDIMFTERSLLFALTQPLFDRAIGANFKVADQSWSAQAGAYGDTLPDNALADADAGEGYGLGSRLTWAPYATDRSVIHLGAFVGMRKPNNAGEIRDASPRFSYETTNMSNVRLVNTGAIEDIDEGTMFGFEGAAMYGPLSIQGEYGHLDVGRDDGRDVAFDAYYVQAGWTITGESRSYKGSDGEFKRLKPVASFGEDGWGAWELAARFDQVDLNDEDISGGDQKRATFALNWYVNENVRLMADYARVLDLEGSPISSRAGGPPDDYDVFTFRTQWAF
jgi:phosphate-selective porin OprO and OprP